MPSDHRDHTVCGICNVSFYVCHKYLRYNSVQVTNPGNKFIGSAYDLDCIGDDEIRDNHITQALVKKQPDQVEPKAGEDWSTLQQHEGKEYFLTYGIPLSQSLYIASPSVRLSRVYFHRTCLEIFRRVSLRKTSTIIWAGLHELGIKQHHAGFRSIERDAASNSNHGYKKLNCENIWLHLPGTQWVVANPVSVHYPVRTAYYVRTSADKDPRQQVFSGDYRLEVGSIGPGEKDYWESRVRPPRRNMYFRTFPHQNASGSRKGKRKETEVDIFIRKRSCSALSAHASGVRAVDRPPSIAIDHPAFVVDPFNAPDHALQASVSSSNARSTDAETPTIIRASSSSPTAPTNKHDFFSTMAPELLVLILECLPAEDVASLRLVGKRFAEIPMRHFRDRIHYEMPWAWELMGDDGKLLPPPAGMEIDYMEMYRLIRRAARPGVRVGAVKGLRNRKRIWGFCERILEIIEEEKMA